MLAFVYRDAKDAWYNGVLKRSKKDTGHIVSRATFVNTHSKAYENFRQLVEEFGDRVEVKVYEVVNGVPPREISLQELSRKRFYTEQELKAIYDEGIQPQSAETGGNRPVLQGGMSGEVSPDTAESERVGYSGPDGIRGDARDDSGLESSLPALPARPDSDAAGGRTGEAELDDGRFRGGVEEGSEASDEETEAGNTEAAVPAVPVADESGIDAESARYMQGIFEKSLIFFGEGLFRPFPVDESGGGLVVFLHGREQVGHHAVSAGFLREREACGGTSRGWVFGVYACCCGGACS